MSSFLMLSNFVSLDSCKTNLYFLNIIGYFFTAISFSYKSMGNAMNLSSFSFICLLTVFLIFFISCVPLYRCIVL